MAASGHFHFPPLSAPGPDQQHRYNTAADAAHGAPARAPTQPYDGLASIENKQNTSKPTAAAKKGAISIAMEARRRIHEDARRNMVADYPVLAELVTNSPEADRYTLHTLSDALSTLYDRPQSSITVSIRRTDLLLHGHSLDLSYALTITLPTSICTAPSNDHNAVALAHCLDDALGVKPDRGTMRFLPLPDWCIGVRGRTLLGVCTEEIQAELAAERVEREAREAREAEAEEYERKWRYVLGGLSSRRRSRSRGKEREKAMSGERSLADEPSILEEEKEEGKRERRRSFASLRALHMRRPRGRPRVEDSMRFAERSDFEMGWDEEEDKEEGEGGNVDRGRKGLKPNKSFASLFRGRSHGS